MQGDSNYWGIAKKKNEINDLQKLTLVFLNKWLLKFQIFLEFTKKLRWSSDNIKIAAAIMVIDQAFGIVAINSFPKTPGEDNLSP